MKRLIHGQWVEVTMCPPRVANGASFQFHGRKRNRSRPSLPGAHPAGSDQQVGYRGEHTRQPTPEPRGPGKTGGSLVRCPLCGSKIRMLRITSHFHKRHPTELPSRSHADRKPQHPARRRARALAASVEPSE